MADVASQIDSLETAISGGVLRVETDGEMIIYRSVAEMLQALNYLKAKQATSAGTASRTTLAAYERD